MIPITDLSILNFMMSPGDNVIPVNEQTFEKQRYKVDNGSLKIATELEVWSPTNIGGNRAVIERVSGLNEIEILTHNGIERPNYQYFLIDERAFEVDLENSQSILMGKFNIPETNLDEYAAKNKLMIQYLLTPDGFDPNDKTTANGKVFFETLIEVVR